MKNTLLIMGGDKRMEYCAEGLSKDFSVYTYGFSGSRPIWELKQADILVLPYLSLSGEYLNAPELSQKIPAVSALDMLKYGGTLFGGGLNDEFLSYCAERDAKVFDFFADEDLTLKNARLTAEGALELILKNTDSALYCQKILILGFGRVACACADVLGALGARITVAARSENARAKALGLGYSAFEISDIPGLSEFDAVINTVPARIFGRDKLERLKNCVYILDLASKPYGVDEKAAGELSLRYEIAPGLPGKTAPKTAGYLIADSVREALNGGDKLG